MDIIHLRKRIKHDTSIVDINGVDTSPTVETYDKDRVIKKTSVDTLDEEIGKTSNLAGTPNEDAIQDGNVVEVSIPIATGDKEDWRVQQVRQDLNQLPYLSELHFEQLWDEEGAQFTTWSGIYLIYPESL